MTMLKNDNNDHLGAQFPQLFYFIIELKLIQGNRDAQLDLSQAQKGHHHGGAPLLHSPHLPPLSLHQTRTEYIRSIPGEVWRKSRTDISHSTDQMLTYGTIKDWDGWADSLTRWNHLMLVINSSSNIIIYVAKVIQLPPSSDQKTLPS